MADICVVYQSEDEKIVERLVSLLRKHWDVWWARDIAHGDWEEAVRAEIVRAKAVVPVLSHYSKGKRIKILKDEMRFADSLGRAILPFVIGTADIPFGFGDINRTEAKDWNGEEGNEGYLELMRKIAETINSNHANHVTMSRKQILTVRGKELHLPAFVFSLSSHETQVTPQDGATLLHELGANASLVSAYDAWKYYRNDSDFHSTIGNMRESENVLFLDSGNYEAYRKNDRKNKKNPKGWQNKYFLKTAKQLAPDLAFSFDTINPKGQPDRIAKRIVSSLQAEADELQDKDVVLCPIVHLPGEHEGTLADCAAQIVASVAKAADPVMIAIPERELGDGILERVRVVRDIRKALDRLGKYYPLHLLGTGNPLSMIALAAAGADSFDGLEWCRTVADYNNGFLFHFQQFEFFGQSHLNRIQDPKVRYLIENTDTPYSVQTLCYNVDFFKDWSRTMQNLIHSGQTETLLKMVPNIGTQVFRELSQ